MDLCVQADQRRGGIGWGIDADRVGQGLATEMGHAVLRFALGALGLHRVQAQCRAENHPSRPDHGQTRNARGNGHQGSSIGARSVVVHGSEHRAFNGAGGSPVKGETAPGSSTTADRHYVSRSQTSPTE
jgi:hypothetical protein